MSSYSVPLPLDSDGFLRRKCPSCEQQFKWHHGPTEGRPNGEVDPPFYWCPLCGASANQDSWWTQEQLDYVRDTATPHIMDEIGAEFKKAFRNTKGISFKPTSSRTEPPDSLYEPDDMMLAEPPCHPWEPIKVPEPHMFSLYCLFCGTNFAV